MPAFDNSAMDGFAVRVADVVDQPLPVATRIYAGDTNAAPLQPGTVAAIMTGAPIPDGADAVIPVEQSIERDGRVRFNSTPNVGAFVRRTGADVEAGSLVAHRGTNLAPRHLAALAATGNAVVPVVGRPRVAVISTGSELVAAGQPLAYGQVYESNSVILAALARAHGAEVTVMTSADDNGGFEAILDAAVEDADVVLTSGGISKGEREPVRDLLFDHGWFGAIAMQPGGPQGLSTWRDTPIINLPGNPVSVMVSFEVLVRDALRAIAGLSPLARSTAQLVGDVDSVAGKTQFLRGRRDGNRVSIVGGAGSHLVATAAAADVLVEIDATTTHVADGEEVQLWPMTP